MTARAMAGLTMKLKIHAGNMSRRTRRVRMSSRMNVWRRYMPRVIPPSFAGASTAGPLRGREKIHSASAVRAMAPESPIVYL